MTESRVERLVLCSRSGEPLTTLEDWRTRASPASPSQWVEYRSALELARLWIDGDGARIVRDTLAIHPDLVGFAATCGVAEAHTRFDRYPGGPRNHDLLLEGTAACGRVVVSIEGKADEPFGETVGDYEQRAAGRRASGVSTNAPDRLLGLVTAIAGTTLAASPGLRDLRYQLFSGVAGALAAATGAQAAVFFVQEFETPLTTPKLLERNAGDLDAFLKRLGLDGAPAARWCIGPVQVPGSELIPSSLPLYFAKARVRL